MNVALPRVVLGAGHAGSELAAKLRQLDPATPVLLVGDEPLLAYQRPPLSKHWLGNREADADSLLIRTAQAYADAGIGTLTGTRVVRIDRAARRLELEAGAPIAYAQLAIATGARARRLELPDASRADAAPNLHYLRTHGDAARLRPQFADGRRAVIVGGGYIGLELAALATRCGLHVTLLEAAPRVLARVTAPQMSAFYERVHREAGVAIHTGVQLRGFEYAPDGAIAGVTWADAHGRPGRCDADLVIVGVGVVPNIELAREAGLACAPDGLLVDDAARTSDPAIVAAGDCTSRPVPGQTGTVRIESVPNAVEQARAAAATLCGLHQPCSAVPWFWSDQYDLKLQMVGLSRGHDQVAIRGDMAARAFTAFYFKDGQLIAADAVNRPADFMFARKLVGAGLRIDAARLADPATVLKELASA